MSVTLVGECLMFGLNQEDPTEVHQELQANGILVHDEKVFGIFAPGGSFKPMDGYTQFTGPVLSIAALNEDLSRVELFSAHLGAIPQILNLTGNMKKRKAVSALLGKSKRLTGRYFAWMDSPSLPNDPTQPGPDGDEIQNQGRGEMLVAKGKTFQISWPFTGIIPLFPLPKDDAFRKEVWQNLSIVGGMICFEI